MNVLKVVNFESAKKKVIKERFITIGPGTPITVVKVIAEVGDQPGGCVMETTSTLTFETQECYLIPEEQFKRIMEGVKFTLEDLDEKKDQEEQDKKEGTDASSESHSRPGTDAS